MGNLGWSNVEEIGSTCNVSPLEKKKTIFTEDSEVLDTISALYTRLCDIHRVLCLGEIWLKRHKNLKIQISIDETAIPIYILINKKTIYAYFYWS